MGYGFVVGSSIDSSSGDSASSCKCLQLYPKICWHADNWRGGSGSGGRGGGTVSEARVPIVIPETSLACLSTNSVRYVQVCCRLGNIERYIIQSLGIGRILLYKHRIQLNYFLALQEIRQNCNSMQPYHKCFPFLLRYRVKCLPKIYSISGKELVPTQTSTLNGFPLYNSLLLTLTLFLLFHCSTLVAPFDGIIPVRLQ